MTTVRTLALVALSQVALGCHSYASVGPETVSPGERVRAEVSPRLYSQLVESGVAGSDRFLEGELVERDDGEITLNIAAALRQQGFFSETLHERVRLDLADVIALERQEIDRSRTYALLGVAAAGVTAVVLQVFSGKTGGNTIDRTDPGPSAARIPIFGLRFR